MHKESWEFTVGDDNTYEGFVNKPLEIGEEYAIFQRALTHDNDVSVVEPPVATISPQQSVFQHTNIWNLL